MNKFEKAALILKEHQEWRLGGEGEPTNPQALTSAINHAIKALTQTADIERGDMVVVPREPTEEMIEAGAIAAFASMLVPIKQTQIEGDAVLINITSVQEYKAMINEYEKGTKNDL